MSVCIFIEIIYFAKHCYFNNVYLLKVCYFFIYSYGTGCFLLRNIGTKVFNILYETIYITYFSLLK